MADYYPLLARAISSLPQNTAEARKAVFDRARTALLRQLRGVDPPLPEGEITRERLGLEEAIRRLEAEAAPQDNEKPEGAEAPSPAPEPVEPPPAAPSTEAEEPAETLAEEAAAPQPDQDTPVEADAPSDPEVATGDAPAPADEDAAARRPALRRGEVRSREAAKVDGKPDGKPVRPSVRGSEPRQGASWKRFALWAVVALVVLGGIVAAVVGRGLLSDGHEGGVSAPVASQNAPAEQPKSEDRMVASGGDAARRAPAPTRNAGTQRAVLLEESPGGTSPPQTFEGTVTWKTETFTAGPGLPPDIGVRGEITIPERQITMSFVLRRNQDQTLPASHTIEIAFKLPQDFALGGIANVPGVRVKLSQQAQGVPLAGLSVKVNPTLFLVGLSPAPADRQRNVALLQVYPWLDVPVIYTNNKRAVVVFEKGPAGDQAFNDAFSAWGELLQNPPQQGEPAEAPAEPPQNAN
ncbi:hypothetical protein [Xanthobacter sp. NM-25]|uniref:hypothetical protein n=1 Tax=Xanthobacter sp. NM-25 TaxID=2744465 RepID=UPI001EE0FF81|nr:hypothetical protein [Xanthobacter sp. NM-25]